MADIELVIKIPEEKLNIIKNKMYCGIYDPDLYKAIRNGSPLPKGHGRLIDADAYRKEMLDSREFNFFATLDFQPTIIEADTESEDKE